MTYTACKSSCICFGSCLVLVTCTEVRRSRCCVLIQGCSYKHTGHELFSDAVGAVRAITHRIKRTMRFQCDDDTIDTTRYVARTSEARHSEDIEI